jgi:hypothetical protein
MSRAVQHVQHLDTVGRSAIENQVRAEARDGGIGFIGVMRMIVKRVSWH